MCARSVFEMDLNGGVCQRECGGEIGEEDLSAPLHVQVEEVCENEREGTRQRERETDRR